jgi:hypothetical protein
MLCGWASWKKGDRSKQQSEALFTNLVHINYVQLVYQLIKLPNLDVQNHAMRCRPFSLGVFYELGADVNKPRFWVGGWRLFFWLVGLKVSPAADKQQATGSFLQQRRSWIMIHIAAAKHNHPDGWHGHGPAQGTVTPGQVFLATFFYSIGPWCFSLDFSLSHERKLS